jgi:hypothetical protein
MSIPTISMSSLSIPALQLHYLSSASSPKYDAVKRSGALSVEEKGNEVSSYESLDNEATPFRKSRREEKGEDGNKQP